MEPYRPHKQSKAVPRIVKSFAERVAEVVGDVELTTEQLAEIASQIPPVDISGKVDKITGSSLVADTEIAKIHEAGSDNQDLSVLQPKETGKGLYPDTDASKLAAIESGANNYSHPANHSPSIITQDASNRFVTDTEKSTWNGKSNLVLGDLITNAYYGDKGKAAYDHSQTTHAPSNAQKNSDITKEEIEAKLTGAISSHSHSGGADPFIAKLILSSDKATGANVTPVTLGLTFNYEASKTYVIDIYGIVSPAAAGTGCGFLIDVSTAVTYVGTFTIHQLAATGTVSGGSSIGDLGATAQGVSSGMVGTGLNFVAGSALLITDENSGTAALFFRSETTAVTTCKAGSSIRVMQMN